jgi:hypothetical protein
MKPWDLDKTLSLVSTRFGRLQELLAAKSVRSVAERQRFANYHYWELSRLFKAFESKHLRGKRVFLDVHFDEGLRSAFEKYIFKAGAHATALVQNIHSIPDILANAVYYSCGLNLGPDAIEEHKVSVFSVPRILGKQASMLALSKALKRSTGGPAWDHLAAIANTSKHRSVVRASLNEDVSGKRKKLREIHFEIVRYRGEQYWSKSVDDVVLEESLRIAGAAIECGAELDRWLVS